MSEELAQIYQAALSDLTAEQLVVGCVAATRECRFFPVPADIRDRAGAQPKQALATLQDELKLRAEREWDALLAGVGEDISMATGAVYCKHPPLSDAGMYAMRQAGGAAGVLDAKGREDANKLHWTRQNFLDAYCRYAETGGLKALPQAEAKRLLAGRHLI